MIRVSNAQQAGLRVLPVLLLTNDYCGNLRPAKRLETLLSNSVHPLHAAQIKIVILRRFGVVIGEL